MRVAIAGGEDRTGVRHVSVASTGDIVLRFDGHKETIDPSNYVAVSIPEPRGADGD